MAKTSPQSPDDHLDGGPEPTGKGRATPSRREREAAQKRPLVPDRKSAAAREAKDKMRQARERARIGMANGEEKYLPERERGPQRRYARDYVDARFSVGEFMIPVMFLVILLTFVQDTVTQMLSLLALWAFFFAAVVDCVILSWRLRKRLEAKFGSMQAGSRWYASMRALQMRRMRLPKPQVKRGEYPA